MSKRSRAGKGGRAGGSGGRPKATGATGGPGRPAGGPAGPARQPGAAAASGPAAAARPGASKTRFAPPRSTRESREAERRRARRRGLLIRVGVVAAVVVGLGAFLWSSLDLGRPHLGIEQPYEGGVGQHVDEGATLPQRNRPPSSGPHYNARAPYGVSTTPLAAGNWIHVLEHGGIVVLYKCASDAECTQRADTIRTTVYDPARPGKHGERKLTATPYQDMDSPITVVAWGRILPLNDVDAAQVLAFYDRYLDRGPEDAP